MNKNNSKVIAHFFNLIFFTSILLSCSSNDDNSVVNSGHDTHNNIISSRIEDVTLDGLANLIIERHDKITAKIDNYEEGSNEDVFLVGFANSEMKNLTSEDFEQFYQTIGYEKAEDYFYEENYIREYFETYIENEKLTSEEGKIQLEKKIHEILKDRNTSVLYKTPAQECFADYQEDIYLCGAGAAIAGGIVTLTTGGLLGTLGLAGAYVAYRQCAKSAKSDYKSCLSSI
ncbi:hypothetical protein FCR2A7T_03040 [Flavobacterium cauense R2A-7]|uniref:Uncharacterized protein n=1 Tax=Flavobacterium cauense R2A-7 TaxID=1341154 RepID=V6S5C9_9FLAO|nr:hypothetical protein [Flavobacterium cauense]ESU21846.1 hypothetical protein FCR2A7T_03040 [Flavobacterium cauense R2A-7]KGO81076.1 hypothetical protein Q762_10595 [Flavobacterium cauense R2A-7]TWI12992.1 hypothetical protein IP98_01474 [Flavobacterium cauense R2A-7]